MRCCQQKLLLVIKYATILTGINSVFIAQSYNKFLRKGNTTMGLMKTKHKLFEYKGSRYLKEKRKRYHALLKFYPNPEHAKRGYGIKWYKSEVFPLEWESTLYSCKNEENIDLDGGVSKPMMVQVYATTKDAIAQRIEKILQVADDTVIVSYDSDKQADLLEDLDNCIKISGQKEGGIH